MSIKKHLKTMNSTGCRIAKASFDTWNDCRKSNEEHYNSCQECRDRMLQEIAKAFNDYARENGMLERIPEDIKGNK